MALLIDCCEIATDSGSWRRQEVERSWRRQPVNLHKQHLLNRSFYVFWDHKKSFLCPLWTCWSLIQVFCRMHMDQRLLESIWELLASRIGWLFLVEALFIKVSTGSIPGSPCWNVSSRLKPVWICVWMGTKAQLGLVDLFAHRYYHQQTWTIKKEKCAGDVKKTQWSYKATSTNTNYFNIWNRKVTNSLRKKQKTCRHHIEFEISITFNGCLKDLLVVYSKENAHYI